MFQRLLARLKVRLKRAQAPPDAWFQLPLFLHSLSLFDAQEHANCLREDLPRTSGPSRLH